MWSMYIGIFIVLIYILDWFLVDRRTLELAEKIGGPFRFPLIGNAHFSIGVTPKNLYEKVKHFTRKYRGDSVKALRIWIGPFLEIAIRDPRHFEIILTSSKFLSKSSLYSSLHASLGEGLLFSSDQKWFTRRRIITPTFHFKILEQFYDVFVKQNKILMEKIGEKPNGKAFDIQPLVSTSIMNTIVETAMGCELKSENFEYFEAVRKLGALAAEQFIVPWMRIKCLYNLSSNKRETKKVAKIMHKFTKKIIESRREMLITHGVSELDYLDNENIGLKKKMCLLDVLLQSTVEGEPLSNADIQEEVDTFTFAGHDTTTTVIIFALFTISKYPEVQAKLNEEIERILGNEDITFKNLNDFKYLDLVIKESMRLYPPVPVIARRLFEEVDFGDFIAPANANYYLVFLTLFRNPKVFENPDDFLPERFLEAEKSPFAFIPFSAGQRNCIGQKFAMINIKTNIIHILRKFVVIPGNIEPTLQLNVTLKCDGIFVGFRKK